MCEHGHMRISADCEMKIKGLKRTYDKHCQHKRQTGRERKEWPFFQAMDELLSTSIEYEAPVVSSHLALPTTSVACATSVGSTLINNSEQPTIQTSANSKPGQTSDGLYRRERTPNARQHQTPSAVLRDILKNMHSWQDEERRRYKQQLKMQQFKLKMLKRLTDST